MRKFTYRGIVGLLTTKHYSPLRAKLGAVLSMSSTSMIDALTYLIRTTTSSVESVQAVRPAMHEGTRQYRHGPNEMTNLTNILVLMRHCSIHRSTSDLKKYFDTKISHQCGIIMSLRRGISPSPGVVRLFIRRSEELRLTSFPLYLIQLTCLAHLTGPLHCPIAVFSESSMRKLPRNTPTQVPRCDVDNR